MELIAEHGQLLIILACIFGLFMAWGIGANDVSNAMGTSVGSKAITIKQAIVIAVIFEFAGAFLAGGEVAETIRKGIIDPATMDDKPDLLVYGMLSSLLASGCWLLIASIKGWPVSTTHSIVGAIIGFAAVGVGMDAVSWGEVGNIAASWVISPVVAGVIGYALFRSIQILIYNKADPFKQAKRVTPFYIMLVGFVISMVTLLKGLTHLGLNLSFFDASWMSLIISFVVMLIGRHFIKDMKEPADIAPNAENPYPAVEKVFGVLMVFTACAMAFAHGSNDVANAIGPVAAIYSVVTFGGEVASNSTVPSWILLLGAGGIVIGLVTFGHRVMKTIGSGITVLNPSRGFAATVAAATTVVVASATGMPISTTQVLVGAILGIGLAMGTDSLNYRKLGSIFISWLVTLPMGAALSIGFFFLFKATLG